MVNEECSLLATLLWAYTETMKSSPYPAAIPSLQGRALWQERAME